MSPPPTAPHVARPGGQAHARARASSPRPRSRAEQPRARRLHEVEAPRSKPSAAAVVGVGHVELAGRRARRIELAQQPHLRARPARRAPVARRSRRFARSIARIRSKSSKSSRRDLPRGALERDAARRAAALARASGGLPTCQAPVPAESSSISPSQARLRDQRAHHALGGRRAADVAQAHEQDPRTPATGYSSPSSSTARNASCGTSTRPTCFIRFLPSFCFSSSFRLRVMSPP